MNQRNESNKVFTEIIFTKTTSKSEAKKINEFWKLIDSQNDIKPFVVEKKLKNPTSSEIKDETLACEKEKCDENFRKDRLFKILGLDKVPPSTSKYKKPFKKKWNFGSDEYILPSSFQRLSIGHQD
ncbi:uncharacterized protein LOC122506825 [Leptopilina heterotoma]|uniref:uncharacterized protein LOC122506825 n=1 Tax=Leptopilina heterotoma TaxID=63436 RepID=UPI001CA7DC0E|nr:uncharacterized protein LOC122506825 [Leptopilina heterotoma]